MPDSRHRRLEDQRLRHAQAIADELRESRDADVELQHRETAASTIVVVDFTERRALRGREALDALAFRTLFGEDDIS